jgi:hypothetical protein
VAWNSFGFIASRADDGQQLLPSEPVKVGIAAQPAEGAYYGDWVWEDADRNGLIDPGEVGAAGVRIELYKDNGDYIADPETDELVSYTITGMDGESDGKYLFANLDAGRYFTVVYLKDGFAASIPPEATPGFGVSTNVLEYTPDDGSFESGTGDWWALPKMKVEPTGGAQDGGAHVEIYNRRKADHGVDLRVENLLQEDRLYTLELYAKVRDVREELRIQLLTNGFDVVSEITADIEPGFGEGDSWTRVTGVLQTFTAPLAQPHTLKISTATSAQDFKFDQVSIKEFDIGFDSDGVRAYVSGMPVAVLPVTDLATGEQQLNWDQGIVQIGQGQPTVWAVAQQGDGRMLIGGEFTAAHGVPRRNIARLLENGQVDSTFDPGSGTNEPVSAFAVMGDGHVIAGGKFSTYDDHTVNGLVSIAPDGSYAAGIAQPDRADVRWMAVDANGRLLVAGGFRSIGGEDRPCIARLNADGSIDSSFRPLDIKGSINGGALLSDGRIAIVGEFKEVAGERMGCVAILDEFGRLDMEFEPDPGADGPIYTVSAKAGGKLLLAGNFKHFNEERFNGTVRIDFNGEIDHDLGESQLDITTVRQSQ